MGKKCALATWCPWGWSSSSTACHVRLCIIGGVQAAKPEGLFKQALDHANPCPLVIHEILVGDPRFKETRIL